MDYSKRMQEAGADALELNFYYVPTSLNLTAVELEKAYVQLVADIRAEIKHSAGGEIEPVLYRTSAIRDVKSSKPERMLWCVSTALFSPIWILKS